MLCITLYILPFDSNNYAGKLVNAVPPRRVAIRNLVSDKWVFVTRQAIQVESGSHRRGPGEKCQSY